MNKKTLLLLLSVSVFAFASTALARPGNGARVDADSTSIIDYQGFAWETGGFPPSNIGNIFRWVAAADAIDAIFGINLLTEEVTFYANNLSSTGQVNLGGGFLSVAYTGGSIEIHNDPLMNHVFGMTPPNATVPSTFTNGNLLLSGNFANFVLFFDSNNGTGAFQGDVNFTAGSALSTIAGIQADGFTFGGVLDTNASGGVVPPGYDLQFDGVLEIKVSVAVEEKTWSHVKGLYSGR